MNTITPPIVDKYTLEQQSTNNINKELGQEDFLELMMAQLKHQDPMEPMDNGEFLGQMAQFSTVTGIDEMKQSMEGLSASYAAGQTLQSTQLVGQEVLVESATLELNDTGRTEGAFELDVASGDVRMDVANSAGTIVRQIELGEYAAGRHTFQWDGMDSSGRRVPQGQYSVQISAQRDDEYVSATVLTTRVIDSVEFGNGTDTILNTRQGDILTLEDIRQIRQRAGADTNSSDN